MNFINHKKRRWNKKGSSFWFIYTLAFLFVIGILYIIFSQVLTVHLYPTTEYLTDGDTTKPDKWLGFWGLTPFIIVFIGLLFLFFKLTQRDSVGD